MIPLQLPTPHSTTINSGCGNGACDSPSVTHTTLYYNQFWWWVGACNSLSVTHTTSYYNQFWWWGLVHVIPCQLPTPQSTKINSGGGCGDRDSPSVIHTTLYYNHFWLWGLGLRFPFSYPHHTLLQSILVVEMWLVIPLQLPTPHSTTINSGGMGLGLRFVFSCPHHILRQSILVVDMVLVIPFQLPTPHSTTINSGYGGLRL